jgi:hypothetical protein
MTKLDELWVAFAKYQSRADKRGHGKTWAEMRELKTEKACREAEYAAEYAAADYAAAAAAAYAGYAAAAAAKYAASKYAASKYAAAKYAASKYAAANAANTAADAEYWAQMATVAIAKAIGETE